MLSIAANPVFGSDNCQRCQAALEVGKFLAMAAPSEGPALAVRLCEYFDFNSDCATEYGVQTIGAVVTCFRGLPQLILASEIRDEPAPLT